MGLRSREHRSDVQRQELGSSMPLPSGQAIHHILFPDDRKPASQIWRQVVVLLNHPLSVDEPVTKPSGPVAKVVHSQTATRPSQIQKHSGLGESVRMPKLRPLLSSSSRLEH